jgi:response regulator RpfG family c-di-GMP phosphodiesterase
MSGLATTPRVSAGKPRILCVDDEPYVLEGLKDTLRRGFDVYVAGSGADGLDLLRADPDAFAVVVSDMRMPVMPGSVFLREARLVAPDVARILLTGYADVESAAAAVNDGQLFRFLTKPCAADELLRACAAALAHHRLVSSERVLLEQTLRGSVQALADVLALASPVAFGRGTRVKALVTRLATAAEVSERWEVEVAALLAPIGAITLPEPVAQKLYTGTPLTPSEADMVACIPGMTRSILQHIPRLENVLEILGALERRFDSATPEAPIPVGALILRIVFDYDALQSQGATDAVALGTLRARAGEYDPALLNRFETLCGTAAVVAVREIRLDMLAAGMVLLDDVYATSGSLLIARGHVASPELVSRLHNFPRGFVREPLRVRPIAEDGS